MLDHIYPYLLVHKKLQLAGIGTLQLLPVSAAVDASGLYILAPHEKINFEYGEVLTSHSFISWVAAVDYLDMDMALSTTHAAISELAASIHLQQPVIISGVGRFNKQGANGISFTPHEPLYTGQEPISIPTGLRWSSKKGFLYQVQPLSVVDTYWWVAAILLALGGAAAIANYYLQINDQF